MSNSYTLKLDNDKLTFGCSAQGLVEKAYSLEELDVFVDNQIKFWRGFNAKGEVSISNTRYRINGEQLSHPYNNVWANIRNYVDLKERIEPLKEILAAASNFQFILADSNTGNRLKEFERKSPSYAILAAMHYSAFVQPKIDPAIKTELIRVSAILQLQEFYNPEVSMFEIKTIESRLEEDRKKISDLDREQQKRANSFNKFTEKTFDNYNNFTSEKTNEFNKYVASHQVRLDELNSYYSEKLTLEEPSKHWENSASDSAKASYFWLVIFILAILVPLGFLLANWNQVSVNVKNLAASNGGLNLGNLFLFTIPALAYGWILKQFSRNYIKASESAADGRHRRTLAMTYLALNKHSNVDEKERAIILNALFRSHNTNSSLEDGPPLGLIELLKK